MSTITKEWLRSQISAIKAVGITESNTLQAFEIALASLEAEPVCVIDQSNLDYLRSGADADVWPASRTEMGDVLLYRTAPPAPTVPDKITSANAPEVFEIAAEAERLGLRGAYASYAVGWNACRAAMLQGAEPVSNRDELPLDYLQGQKDGLEWAAQLAEANHPHTGDWLYDDPIELAKAIRKGPDMPELKSVPADADDNFYSWFGRFWSENYQQNNYTTSAKQMLGTMAEFAFRAGRESATQVGNSPVIPDGWVACSERMPEKADEVLCAKEFDGPGDWRQKVGYYLAGKWTVYSASWTPTHWMPLPAAPQQEVK